MAEYIEQTSSGAYSGCGGVYQLGSYSNIPDTKNISKKTQNREEILNTLIGGSNTPNNIKKCSELLTADKKKGIKLNSES